MSRMKTLTLGGGGRRGHQENSHLQRSCGGGFGPLGFGRGWEQLWLPVVGDIVSLCWC